MSPRHLYLIGFVFLLAPFAWSPSSLPNPEVERIQSHFLRAERLAARHDLSTLTSQQRKAREANLARLERYRRAAIFPHNHDFAGARVPYFQDRHGTLCAVGYLIQRTGGGDLVQAVVRRMNNATVMQIAADPVLGSALLAWLRDAGLTLNEAQAIQPLYGYSSGYTPTDVTEAYAVSSMAVGGLNIMSTCVNAGLAGPNPSPWFGRVGLVTGFVGVGMGIAHFTDDEQGADMLHFTNISVGAISIVTSAVALHRHARRSAVPPSAQVPRVAPFYGFVAKAHPVAGVSVVF